MANDPSYIVVSSTQPWADIITINDFNDDTGAVIGPSNLTGKTLTATVASDSATINLSAGAGATILNAAAGLIALSLTNAQLLTLQPGDQATIDFTVWNADNTVFLTATLAYQIKAG